MIPWLLLIIGSLQAMDGSLQQGHAQAQSLLQGYQLNAQHVPDHQANPPQAGMDEGMLMEQALRDQRTNPAAQALHNHQAQRQRFRLDPMTDPLFVQSQQALTGVQGNENNPAVHTQEQAVTKHHICHEGGDVVQKPCHRRLNIVLTITPETKEHKGWRYPNQHRSPKSGQLRCGKTGCGCEKGECVKEPIYKTTPKKVTVTTREWISDCQALEDNTEKGLCHYVSRTQSPSPETRMIQGEPITEDHFEETYTYACYPTIPDTCAPLKAKGCVQIASRCQETMDNVCVAWEQTYACTTHAQQGNMVPVPRTKDVYCLDGQCVPNTYKANKDMGEVLTQMSIVKQAQSDARTLNAIFKGNAHACSRNCVDFKDCCTTQKGWGMSIHLASCTPDEQHLARLRTKNRCVLVGTYCAKKVLGQCVTKKTSFCCFGSTLSRLVQEQGRAQLGKGWGDPQSPDCGGLTPAELSRLDFSRMNLSELYHDVQASMTKRMPQEAGQGIALERVKETMQNLVRAHRPQGDHP